MLVDLCIYSGPGVIVMFSFLVSLKQMCSYFFNQGAQKSIPPPVRTPLPTQHVLSLSLPPQQSAPLLPDFDLCPSDSLLATVGEGVVFSVANPLDLALQGQNLLANVLVVEVKSPTNHTSMLWFRFDSESLATRGVSVRRLFSDDNADVSSTGDAVDSGCMCGWVIDKKRM